MVFEERKRDKTITKLIESLKTNGTYGEYLIRNSDIQSFINRYEEIISRMKVSVWHKSATEDDAQHIAIYGNKITAPFLGRIPGANLTRHGMLQGIELNISRYNEDLVVKLAVLPYSEKYYEEEGFLITQGILERITDNKYSREVYDKIIDDLKSHGYFLIPEIPDQYFREAETSPYVYYPKSNLYEFFRDTSCPDCSYQFTADLMLKSKLQKETETTCPRCSHKFVISI
jgi:DNA-directed RNA polymerase subunit RPC12/RpoP